MEGHTLALKVIEVMFCSSEDASVTQNMWRNSCAVTHKPPPPSPAPPLPSPPQPITDCGESLTVTLRSLCPRFCEQETVDDQFETCVLPWRKAAAYGYTWFTCKHACCTGVCPLPPLHAPTHPPLTNTQTRAYINYPATCCYAYFWWLWGVACSYVIRQRRLV